MRYVMMGALCLGLAACQPATEAQNEYLETYHLRAPAR